MTLNTFRILGNKKRKSAVYIPLIYKNNQWHILFEKRSGNIPQPGEICFPGGLFEEGRDVNTEETALRELCEELGIANKQIEKTHYFGTMVTPMQIDVYFGEIKLPDQLNINIDEVEEILLIPLTFFKNQPPKEHILHMHSTPADNFPELYQLPERYQGQWHPRERKLYFFQWQSYTIWGITGEIIKHFCEEYNSGDL